MQVNLDTDQSKERIFSGCRLDPIYQTIATHNKVIRLRGKLFAVLCCLIDNEGKLVTRQELIDCCWHGNALTGEKAVTHTICHLRKLFRQLNISASIATLSKQGYLFSTKDTLLKYAEKDHRLANNREI